MGIELDTRIGLIQWLVGPDPCYVAIGSKIGGDKNSWADLTYAFPSEADDISTYFAQHTNTSDIYFCPTPLSARNRTKHNVPYSWCLWADLDECPPDKLLVPPSIIVQTSPGRHQAFWKLKSMASPFDVEDINKRIAYHHKMDGCDITGWDLTQMMRVPLTYNFKYQQPPPQVKLSDYHNDRVYDLKDFNVYPELEETPKAKRFPKLPEKLPNETAEQILDDLNNSIHPRVWRLYNERPEHDWSRNLWDLEQCLFEAGALPEQVFIVVKAAACNKFERDGLGDNVLWKEVLRAQHYHKNRGYSATSSDAKIINSDRELLSDEEMSMAKDYGTFIDQYRDWGSTASDAPPQYHVGGALIILSAILSNRLRLDTSFGSIIPNVWVMLVADTTLTRKSTTMDMAIDVITDILPDALMATDGSVEGIMQAMSVRPGVTSIFMRDEFSGMLDAMVKKDYMAGFMEMLTKLYDNKPYRRQLKRETILVDDPVFLMYTGGVKERLYNLIQPHHISSGFFPRFMFIAADADFNRIRPLGPPTATTAKGRMEVIDRTRDMANAYNSPSGGSIFASQYRSVELTPGAWRRYNMAEEILQLIGYHSGMDDMLTPMLTRLAVSGLKVATLLAGSEQLDSGTVVVDEMHIIKALSYLESFKADAIQVVNNTGQSTTERLLRRVFDAVAGSEGGLARSILMQRFGLMAKDANIIIGTLAERNLVRQQKINGVQMVSKVA